WPPRAPRLGRFLKSRQYGSHRRRSQGYRLVAVFASWTKTLVDVKRIHDGIVIPLKKPVEAEPLERRRLANPWHHPRPVTRPRAFCHLQKHRKNLQIPAHFAC